MIDLTRELKKNNMIILADAQMAFDKVQYRFRIKGYRIMCFNIMKTIYDKPTANIILNCKGLLFFPQRSKGSQRHSLSTVLFNRNVIARTIRQKPKIKSTQIGEEQIELPLL